MLGPTRSVRRLLVLARDVRRRDRPSSLDIINHQNQLVVMIAVQHLDVDARVGHHARQGAELAGSRLIEPRDHDLAVVQHPDARSFKPGRSVNSMERPLMPAKLASATHSRLSTRPSANSLLHVGGLAEWLLQRS